MPLLTGSPILIRDQPELTAHRGKLLSGRTERGTPVYAASFIRKREIVLETEILSSPELLRLILVHEIFHFIWCRLGNSTRQQFAEVLGRERVRRAKGELGESSSLKKGLLLSGGNWPDYVCESFCDTAAWLYSGVKESRVFNLANRWRNVRKAWFENTFASCCRC